MKNIRTTFYNVGHGDSILIHLDNEKIVSRDFGKSKQSVGKGNSIDENQIIICSNIKAIKNYCSVDAVLSHAHEDHFSGYKILHGQRVRKLFDIAYIPWLDYSTLQTLSAKLLKLSVYLYIYYGAKHPSGVNAKNWILVAPIMSDLSSSLLGVAAGYQMTNWNPKGIVVWPPPPKGCNPKNETQLDNAIEEIESNMDQVFLSELMETLIEPLRKLLNEVIQNTNNQNENMNYGDRASELLERSSQLQDQSQQITIKRTTLNLFNNNLDDHSVVFYLEDNSALYLSDLRKSCINRMVSNYLPKNTHFDIMKSSHHGSRFGKNLIKCGIKADAVVHCCGISNKRIKGPDPNYANVGSVEYFTDWNPAWNKTTPRNTFICCCETF